MITRLLRTALACIALTGTTLAGAQNISIATGGTSTTTLERAMLIVAGFALVYPTVVADLLGIALVLAALTLQYLRGRPVPA